jgi:hypothetical protein
LLFSVEPDALERRPAQDGAGVGRPPDEPRGPPAAEPGAGFSVKNAGNEKYA